VAGARAEPLLNRLFLVRRARFGCAAPGQDRVQCSFRETDLQRFAVGGGSFSPMAQVRKKLSIDLHRSVSARFVKRFGRHAAPIFITNRLTHCPRCDPAREI
jgi:hypothetical protein